MFKSLKYVFGVVVCLHIVGQTTAQITFSKRIPLLGGTYGSWVKPVDDGYRLLGTTSDTLDGLIHIDMYHLKLDLNGNFIQIKQYGENGHFLHLHERMANNHFDGGYVVGCSTYPEGHSQLKLIWLNSEGDTIRSRLYSSPFSDSEDESIQKNYIKRHLLTDSIGNIYVSGSFYLSQAEGRIAAIIKYNPEGEMLWITPVVETNSSQSAIMQMYLTDSVLYTAGATINVGVGGQFLDPYNRYFEHYGALNLEGNILWMNHERPEFNCQGFRDILPTPEGLIILSNYFASEVLYSEPVLHKVGWNNELVWAHPYPPENEISGFRRIAKTCDGQYIIAGQFRTGDGMGAIDSYGTLTKTDTWGNIIWTRKYTYVDSYQDDHEFIDLKQTSDGGYVMVGDAVDEWLSNPDLELPIQQLWIVKTDACGCLIPGCDPNCTHTDCPTDEPAPGEELPATDDPFLVGPNPCQDQLFVYLKAEGLNPEAKHLLQIHDIRGALLGSYALNSTDATYIIRTDQWADGLYVLTLLENGVVMGRKKIVKE